MNKLLALQKRHPSATEEGKQTAFGTMSWAPGKSNQGDEPLKKFWRRQQSVCNDGIESPSIAGTFILDESCNSSNESRGTLVLLSQDEDEGMVHMLAATATPRTPAMPSDYDILVRGLDKDIVSPLETPANGISRDASSPTSSTAQSVISAVSSLSNLDLTESLCDGDSYCNGDNRRKSWGNLHFGYTPSQASSKDCRKPNLERGNGHLNHNLRRLRNGSNNRQKKNAGSSASSSVQEHQRRQRMKKPIWKRALDPATGRTYYFEQLTRKAQWKKPFELYTANEKRKELEMLHFFRDMEASLYRSLSRGELIPGVNPHHSLKAKVASPTTDSTSSQSGSTTLPHMLAESPSSCSPIAPVAIRRHLKQTVVLASEPRIVMHHERANSLTPPEVLTGTNPANRNIHHDTECSKPCLGAVSGKKRTHYLNNESGMQVPSHIRRNTCGTIYVTSTISSPDIVTTTRCICKAFQKCVLREPNEDNAPTSPVSVAHSLVDSVANIFNDITDIGLTNCDFPLCIASEPPFPTLDEIIFFYQEVFKRANTGLDTVIMTFIYVERLMRETSHSVRPTPKNWKSVLFACIALACKVWDDLNMRNAKFTRVCSSNGDKISDTLASFTLPRINELERALLKCLNFNVKITAGEYAQHYFLLRSKLTPEERTKEALFKPLDIKGAKALEVCSGKYQQAAVNQTTTTTKSRRARSLVDYSWLHSTNLEERSDRRGLKTT